MTQRLRLDNYLVEQAAEAGAEVREGVRVSDLTTDAGAVSLRVDGQPVTARSLVGADGVNGTVRRALDLAGDPVMAVALRATWYEVRTRARSRLAEVEFAIVRRVS
jgi:flavin-dependent dehydrogenase